MESTHTKDGKMNHIICKMPKIHQQPEQLGVQFENSTWYNVVRFFFLHSLFCYERHAHVWTLKVSGHSRHVHNKPVEIKTNIQCATEKWFIVNKLIGNFIKYFCVFTVFYIPNFFHLWFNIFFASYFFYNKVKFRDSFSHY